MVAVSFSRCGAGGPLLDAATACLDAGDLVGAGVRIRHATTLLLIAFAESCGIKRPLRKFPRPARIARALHHSGRVDKATLESILEVLYSCNALAHCEEASATTLRDGAALIASLAESWANNPHRSDPPSPGTTP
jgi:hypothetical protein